MKPHLKIYSFTIDPLTGKALEMYSEKTGLSRSEIVRRLIADAAKEWAKVPAAQA